MNVQKLCARCGDPIQWVKSAATGRWMILNASPDAARGNVLIVAGRAHVYHGPHKAIAHDSLADRFLDHHVTCHPTKGEEQ